MTQPIRTPVAGRALLDFTRIYAEPASHWQIPELHGDEGNVARWVRIKREALVLGVKKSLTARPIGRSADLIAPSLASGCAMACAYCYVRATRVTATRSRCSPTSTRSPVT